MQYTGGGHAQVRLGREKAALQEHVDRLEAELEDRARDEHARMLAEREEMDLYVTAMADDAADRLGWTAAGSGTRGGAAMAASLFTLDGHKRQACDRPTMRPFNTA